MRIDWYPSYPHEKVISIAEQLYSYLLVKSQGANKSDIGKINYPARTFLEMHKTLIQLNWITETLGVKGESLTLIEPAPILKEMFDDIGLFGQNSV